MENKEGTRTCTGIPCEDYQACAGHVRCVYLSGTSGDRCIKQKKETRKFKVVIEVEIPVPNKDTMHLEDGLDVEGYVESMLYVTHPSWRRHSIGATEVDEFGT